MRRHRQTARSVRAADDGLLVELGVPFDNPGKLRILMAMPARLPSQAPLVVVLHGCTQSAGSYDRGAGWSTLAARHGFAVLYPEQQRANNPNNCFNWFQPGDTTRGGGEAASIANAVAAMVAAHDLDPVRVFVTGLSAGGAMTAAMLATYPDVFAGGAVIAGLPYGVASGVPEALSAMATPPARTAAVLGDRVRAASTHHGPWPRVSIWHGDADRTVVAGNAEALALQWLDVHGLKDAPPSEVRDGRHGLTVWRNAGGVPVVELNRIDGMAHGTPLGGADDGQAAGPYMLEVGVASSARIAGFFGLLDPQAASVAPKSLRPATIPAPAPARLAEPRQPSSTGNVRQVIDDALRAAGLLR